ncbi:phosphate acetyltransferase, partial [Streptomyces broussonetiae]
MTRSLYMTGIGRGDGRQVVDLGIMELLTRHVDRVGVYRPLAHEGPDLMFVLVLGTDYHDTQLPAELTLNATLANEFGAYVLIVVGGLRQTAETAVDEVHNAHLALTAQGCDVVAPIANRVPPDAATKVATQLNGRLPVPVYVLPEDTVLAAHGGRSG